jgi:hypothetical protein
MSQADLGAFHLSGGSSLQLFHYFHSLTDTGAAEGVPDA